WNGHHEAPPGPEEAARQLHGMHGALKVLKDLTAYNRGCLPLDGGGQWRTRGLDVGQHEFGRMIDGARDLERARLYVDSDAARTRQRLTQAREQEPAAA